MVTPIDSRDARSLPAVRRAASAHERWRIAAICVLVALVVASCRTGARSGTSRAGPVATAQPDSLIERFYAAYVAAAERRPGAGERFLTFYHDSVHFEDPTYRVRAIGKEEFRTRVVEPNLRAIRFANVRWSIDRRAHTGEWSVVEGTLTAIANDAPTTRRFTTWLRFRDGRIVHQIDYFSP